MHIECNTKDVQGHGPSNINLSLFVYFFDVYRARYINNDTQYLLELFLKFV